MSRLDIMEWTGAMITATAVGLYDFRLGILSMGIWIIWAANFGGGDGTDDQ